MKSRIVARSCDQGISARLRVGIVNATKVFGLASIVLLLVVICTSDWQWGSAATRALLVYLAGFLVIGLTIGVTIAWVGVEASLNQSKEKA